MFLKKLNKKKFVLLIIFLFVYLSLILFNGERGLISYFEKQKIKKNLIEKQELLLTKLTLFEKKNTLLSDNLDLDYLETLYRKKFMLGKSNEKIYIN
jgi:cell division protein DivIC